MIQEAYRAATSSNSQDIEFTKCQTMPDHPHVEQAYIGYIKADQILKLATNRSDVDEFSLINQTVFFDNIRDFNPRSKINEGIIGEINNGDKLGFVFRNNGVTVVAKKINRTGDRFKIDDYQIVNGCQTSNILFRCKDEISDIFVPFRLIASREDSFITSIIIGTNNQNPVKEEQFWALRPFMKDLEEFCKQQPGDLSLYLERRENQYRSENIERTRIVKPSDLMKAVAAMYLFQPHRAARDFRGIRAEFDTTIFQPDHDVIPYHLSCYANYKFEFFIRNKRIKRSARIYKYYTLFALGYQFCVGNDIFSVKKLERKSICDKLRELLIDEAAFVSFCENISLELDEMLFEKFGGSPIGTPREKLRDTLRSESFSKEFRQRRFGDAS